MRRRRRRRQRRRRRRQPHRHPHPPLNDPLSKHHHQTPRQHASPREAPPSRSAARAIGRGLFPARDRGPQRRLLSSASFSDARSSFPAAVRFPSLSIARDAARWRRERTATGYQTLCSPRAQLLRRPLCSIACPAPRSGARQECPSTGRQRQTSYCLSLSVSLSLSFWLSAF